MLNLQTLLHDTRESLLLLQSQPLPQSLARLLQQFTRLLSAPPHVSTAHTHLALLLASSPHKQSSLPVCPAVDLTCSPNSCGPRSCQQNPKKSAHSAELTRLQELLRWGLRTNGAGEDINNTISGQDKENQDENRFTEYRQSQMEAILIEIRDITLNYLSKNHQEEDSSKCNSEHQQQASHSGSVRSLLTEQLRKVALEEQDPECRGSRIIVRGNLMRQLREQNQIERKQAGMEPMAAVYSVQAKLDEAEMASWLGQKSVERSRVQSQRTILRQMNLNETKGEKKNKQDNMGCARCEIY